MLKEFRPCDGYEDTVVVFGESDLWMNDSTTLLVNSTVELKEDIDDSFEVRRK